VSWKQLPKTLTIELVQERGYGLLTTWQQIDEMKFADNGESISARYKGGPEIMLGLFKEWHLVR
jgi:hypothetical protein